MHELATDRDAFGDPQPSFPTEAELAIAARLRHRIEERYLAPSEVPPEVAAGPDTSR
jgi:hypothetical protein